MGSRNDNDIIIKDPTVSQKHAELKLIKGNFILVDFDSQHGTYFKVRDQISLAKNMTLEIGSYQFKVGEISIT